MCELRPSRSIICPIVAHAPTMLVGIVVGYFSRTKTLDKVLLRYYSSIDCGFAQLGLKGITSHLRPVNLLGLGHSHHQIVRYVKRLFSHSGKPMPSAVTIPHV